MQTLTTDQEIQEHFDDKSFEFLIETFQAEMLAIKFLINNIMTKSTSNIPTDPFAKYPAFLNTFDKIQMYLFEEEKNIPKHHKLTTKEEKLRKI